MEGGCVYRITFLIGENRASLLRILDGENWSVLSVG